MKLENIKQHIIKNQLKEIQHLVQDENKRTIILEIAIILDKTDIIKHFIHDNEIEYCLSLSLQYESTNTFNYYINQTTELDSVHYIHQPNITVKQLTAILQKTTQDDILFDLCQYLDNPSVFEFVFNHHKDKIIWVPYNVYQAQKRQQEAEERLDFASRSAGPMRYQEIYNHYKYNEEANLKFILCNYMNVLELAVYKNKFDLIINWILPCIPKEYIDKRTILSFATEFNTFRYLHQMLNCPLSSNIKQYETCQPISELKRYLKKQLEQKQR